MPPIKIVLKTKKGEVIKGTTSDFSPANSTFHFIPLGLEKSSKSLEIVTNNLKAIFFVKDFDGHAYRDGYNHSKIEPKAGERLVTVKFNDGEVTNGIVRGFHLNRPGFFMTPTDPKSNNERIYVILSDLDGLVIDGKELPVKEMRLLRNNCPACNAPLEFNWRYCPYDGTRLKS
ncbi:MAG: zinc ribbon domain-containing protein [Proteobacteria bacterium]|nr:zinc ribbon domain-containing protein [Pseudomonadota bacterium]MBU1736748.1 zinc ribbon domain-containing protein [Pseudomonadota bacterium]